MSGVPHAAFPARRAHPPRGRVRQDLIYLGWQHALPRPEPGPIPLPPVQSQATDGAAEPMTDLPRWRRRPARPARLGTAAGVAIGGAAVGSWQAGLLKPAPALFAFLGGVGLAVACARSLIASGRALRAQARAERVRLRSLREAEQADLATRREQHARSYRDWQGRATAFWRQPCWYPVTMPTSVARLDLAGGTLAGWSALLTTIAATRLAAGGTVTVVDLTEGGVATDLLALAASLGIEPLVWVLPADLPRLDLGLRLSHESLAEVLALTAAAADSGPSGTPASAADPARDGALLARVLEVLGPDASIAGLIAGLRTLAQIGAPHQQLSAGVVSPDQLTRLTAMFGRGADHLVVDRAWSLEARLRALSMLGASAAGRPQGPLRVMWADRRSPATGNRVLGCYLTVALTEVLRQSPAGRPWQQTICLLGADRLPGDVLDRLCDAAECARAGLLLGFRAVPGPVKERLGRGNAALGVMRLGNAEDARTAAEQIGSEHRFVISQLTDTIGTSVTTTAGDSYTSTVGTSDSVADSRSVSRTDGQGRGRSSSGMFAPLAAASASASREASRSTALSDSRSITSGISASTSWGLATSKAVGTSGSLSGTLQRSRELLIEQHELQHLPQTAVVVCQHGPRGREVRLADVNPAIMTLPTATLAELAADLPTGEPRPAQP
jgi:hypothetical protein